MPTPPAPSNLQHFQKTRSPSRKQSFHAQSSNPFPFPFLTPKNQPNYSYLAQPTSFPSHSADPAQYSFAPTHFYFTFLFSSVGRNHILRNLQKKNTNRSSDHSKHVDNNTKISSTIPIVRFMVINSVSRNNPSLRVLLFDHETRYDFVAASLPIPLHRTTAATKSNKARHTFSSLVV